MPCGDNVNSMNDQHHDHQELSYAANIEQFQVGQQVGRELRRYQVVPKPEHRTDSDKASLLKIFDRIPMKLQHFVVAYRDLM